MNTAERIMEMQRSDNGYLVRIFRSPQWQGSERWFTLQIDVMLDPCLTEVWTRPRHGGRPQTTHKAYLRR
jgi:hypothetical protein